MHNTGTEIIKSNLKIRKLKIVLVLLASYLVVEILTGFYTGSLALIADAGHMLADTFGICIALIAAIYSKKEATPVHTFGFFRTEILASFLNSIILSLLSIIIIYEAYRRIFEPLEIQSLPMIIVAIVGLLINIIGMYVLRGEYFHTHNNEDEVTQNKKHTNKQVIETEDLNIQGAKLELLSDTIGSVGVISGGILIAITSINVIDPILSIGLSLFILPRIFNLLKKSVHILMEGVPSNISYELIQQELLKIKGVTGVFDLHIWSITSGLHALSAHVVVMDTSNSYQILDEINSLLEKKFNITHSTIQIERFHPIDNNE